MITPLHPNIIFYIRHSVQYKQEKFVQQSKASSVAEYPLYSCDHWLIVACFVRVWRMLMTLLFALEIKFVLKIESSILGN